jgi:hypothetical protein
VDEEDILFEVYVRNVNLQRFSQAQAYGVL